MLGTRGHARWYILSYILNAAVYADYVLVWKFLFCQMRGFQLEPKARAAIRQGKIKSPKQLLSKLPGSEF